MSRFSRFITVAIAAAVATVAVVPFGKAAESRAAGKGYAATSIKLLTAELSSVPVVGDVGASLGTVTADASTLERPLANILVEAVKAGDKTLGSHRVSSDDSSGGASEGATFPLNAAGIDGAVSVARLRAEATEDSAKALIEALTGNVKIASVGFGASAGEQGIRSVVDSHESSSRAGVAVGPIEVRLADLLPAELLNALPLNIVLDLAKKLNLPLGDLSGVFNTLRQVVSTIDDVQAKIDELNEARRQLSNLINDNAPIQAAQDAVDSALAEVAAAEAVVAQTVQDLADLEAQKASLDSQIASLKSERDALVAQLADCNALGILCTLVGDAITAIQNQIAALNGQIAALENERAGVERQIAAARQALDEAQAALDAARATLAAARAELQALIDGAAGAAIQTLQNLIDQLQAQLTELIDTLEDLLKQLPDIKALLDELLDGIGDASVLSVGKISFEVSAMTDADSGNAAVDCSADGVSVLGQSVGAQSCRELVDALASVSDSIAGVLRKLPVAGGAIPKTTVAGLEVTEAVSGPDAEGFRSATAGITALHVGIPSVSLKSVVDDVVADALAAVEGITGSSDITTTVEDLLSQVEAQLSALPTGDVLAGLKTVGVDMRVGGLTTTSRFRANAVPESPDTPETPETETPDAPNPDDEPRSPNAPEQEGPNAPPAPEEQGGPMPFTGGPAVFPAAIALWLLAAGAMLMAIEKLGFSWRKPTAQAKGE